MGLIKSHFGKFLSLFFFWPGKQLHELQWRVSLLFTYSDVDLNNFMSSSLLPPSQYWLLASAWTSSCSFLGKILEVGLLLFASQGRGRRTNQRSSSWLHEETGTRVPAFRFLAWCFNCYIKLSLLLFHSIWCYTLGPPKHIAAFQGSVAPLLGGGNWKWVQFLLQGENWLLKIFKPQLFWISPEQAWRWVKEQLPPACLFLYLSGSRPTELVTRIQVIFTY